MEQNKDQSGAAVRGEAVADELKLLHRGGHSPSTSGNGIAKSWMDELDQSREYMRSHGEKSSKSGAPAAANELVDSSKPPAGLDTREQMIWMMGRNSKPSSLSARAADAPSDLPTEILAKVMTRDDFNCSTELGYAQFLAWEIWLKSYCNVSPDFSIMDNLKGVLSQIDNMVCGLSRAADALDSQPTMPTRASNGWFSVDDRLPNVGTKALTAGYIRNIPGNNFWQDTAMYTRDGWFYEYQQEHHYKPTHWMPLPPGPASSQPTDGGVRNG